MHLEILTPVRKLFDGAVSEVVIPAYDGEVGVLPGHANFIGALGTGPLKIVRDGDDYWFLVSEGFYRVQGDRLVVLAEIGEQGDGIDLDKQTARLKELEREMADHQTFKPERYDSWRREYDQVRSRIEIHRRTSVVN